MKYTDCKYKYEKRDYIRGKLECDLGWAIQGLKRIYEQQTSSEQSCGDTHDLNGVGFSGCHAEILSSFAEKVLAGRELTNKQQVYLFKYMPKYTNQLFKISENTL